MVGGVLNTGQKQSTLQLGDRRNIDVTNCRDEDLVRHHFRLDPLNISLIEDLYSFRLWQRTRLLYRFMLWSSSPRIKRRVTIARRGREV